VTDTMNARELAVKLLLDVEDGAYSDLVLKRELEASGLDKRDSAFCTAIVFGTLQNRMLLDHYISKYSSLKMNKISKKVLTILRISAYQMIFMDRVPHNAAVNEAVNIVKKSGNSKASGFVNAVLRSISRNIDSLPEVEGNDELEKLSVKYSHPLWMVKKLSGSVESLEAFLDANNHIPPLTVRVNTLKTDRSKVSAMLEAEGVSVKYGLSPDSMKLTGAGNIEKLSCFADGLITVQDEASQLCVYALKDEIKDRKNKILDACAAPGGKSFAMYALSGGMAEITSCDIHEKKLKLMSEEAERLGVKLSTHLRDAKKRSESFVGAFDVILADVPCSGLGVIRKKPDIRYKAEENIERLPEVQKKILQNVSSYLKDGGTMIYSTCTVLKEENEQIVREFLNNNENFELVRFELPGIGRVDEGMITLLPHIHGTDGFFIAKLRKK